MHRVYQEFPCKKEIKKYDSSQFSSAYTYIVFRHIKFTINFLTLLNDYIDKQM